MITSANPTTLEGYDVFNLESDASTDAGALLEFDGWCNANNALRSKVRPDEPTSAPIEGRRTAVAYPAGTTAMQGNQIYEQKVIPALVSGDVGKVVGIDCESRDYALAATAMDASQEVNRLHPDARLFLKRIIF